MSINADELDVTEAAEHTLIPIPEHARTSTVAHQFWIWTGANIAPINWVLGALGIILGLSLVETIVVLVVGNLVGCAFFGLFCVMGHRTGVNQMVLSRVAFGRRGAYLPAAVQLLMTMGWLGVNTWVVLDLVLGIFEHMGYDNPGTGTKYAVGIGIMAAVLPLLFTERGEEMTFIISSLLLLVSGVYYPISVLPGWMQAAARISPATYVLEGMRATILDGRPAGALGHYLLPMAVIGLITIPLGMLVFTTVERYAKRTGRLKRSG